MQKKVITLRFRERVLITSLRGFMDIRVQVVNLRLRYVLGKVERVRAVDGSGAVNQKGGGGFHLPAKYRHSRNQIATPFTISKTACTSPLNAPRIIT